jgi:proteasome lid subunit RPN8/RPN11
VVGWYHSHPGLGAFFSHTDRRTQQAFFAHAYSVGWVVDPLRGESAWFVGPRSLPPAVVIHAAP